MNPTDRVPLRTRVSEHVAARAARLQREYQSDERRTAARAAADLARLRRSVTLPIGRDPLVTGLAIGGLYENPAAMPEEPQRAEIAAYTALTLFALHQQSHRTAKMHQQGYSLGRSARLLGRHSEADEAGSRRFAMIATATTWDETVYHARGMVQQLRGHDIPLDYGMLARDFFDLRDPRHVDDVRLRWGRDFYRTKDPDDDKSLNGAEAPEAESPNTPEGDPA